MHQCARRHMHRAGDVCSVVLGILTKVDQNDLPLGNEIGGKRGKCVWIQQQRLVDEASVKHGRWQWVAQIGVTGWWGHVYSAGGIGSCYFSGVSDAFPCPFGIGACINIRVGRGRNFSCLRLRPLTIGTSAGMSAVTEPKQENLVWMDLEMTGLDPDQDVIIEIATIITDPALNILAEGPSLAVHQSEAMLAGMDEWNTTHHGASGLTERVRASTTTTADAEAQTLAFIQQWTEAGRSPLCGNSIGQDRRFLYRYMPNLSEWLHYRNIDVSTVKELARCWRPDVLAGVQKSGQHLALADIRESIGELQHYREHFFRL